MFLQNFSNTFVFFFIIIIHELMSCLTCHFERQVFDINLLSKCVSKGFENEEKKKNKNKNKKEEEEAGSSDWSRISMFCLNSSFCFVTFSLRSLALDIINGFFKLLLIDHFCFALIILFILSNLYSRSSSTFLITFG